MTHRPLPAPSRRRSTGSLTVTDILVLVSSTPFPFSDTTPLAA
jgi:hypothetical protein